MADLTITVASVAPGTNARIDKSHAAGEALTIGVAVYLNGTNQRWYMSDTDVSEPAATMYGITVTNAAAAGQPVCVQFGGNITAGATLVAGEVYGVGEAAGGIAPVADCAVGEYERILGFADSTTVLRLTPCWTTTVRAA